MVVNILTIFVFISANFIDDEFDSVTFHNIKSDTDDSFQVPTAVERRMPRSEMRKKKLSNHTICHLITNLKTSCHISIEWLANRQ